jgi:hypothetical protein
MKKDDEQPPKFVLSGILKEIKEGRDKEIAGEDPL